ncbi:MAG: hypothetical protein Q9191_002638 [Dirinaria sp. TL-2023a]
MDPSTAFSLACGIIQLVDFSLKAFKKCKEIHDYGALSEYEGVQDTIQHLVNLQADLSLQELAQTSASTQISSGKALLELAAQCSGTAQELADLLETLKVSGLDKKRGVFKVFLRSLRIRPQIKAIQARLDGHRSAIDTQLLVSLRQRWDLSTIQQSRGFKDLEQKVQILITGLSAGPKGFEELRILLQNEGERTRAHITTVLERQARGSEEQDLHQRLLDSLWFDEINSREERITDAHRDTFKWIFDKSDQALGPWDNYVQ